MKERMKWGDKESERGEENEEMRKETREGGKGLQEVNGKLKRKGEEKRG